MRTDWINAKETGQSHKRSPAYHWLTHTFISDSGAKRLEPCLKCRASVDDNVFSGWRFPPTILWPTQTKSPDKSGLFALPTTTHSIRTSQPRILRRVEQDSRGHEGRAVEDAAFGGGGFEGQFRAAEEVFLAFGHWAHGEFVGGGQANGFGGDFVDLQDVGGGRATGQGARQQQEQRAQESFLIHGVFSLIAFRPGFFARLEGGEYQQRENQGAEPPPPAKSDSIEGFISAWRHGAAYRSHVLVGSGARRAVPEAGRSPRLYKFPAQTIK